ncbi:MAG TPA: lysylphosphatidylglycerol synthase domain-containing protein [Chroococcidiopsis sp.]
MLKRLLRLLPALISVILLIASIWVIRQELQQYQSQEIWRHLAAIPRSSLGWAIALTLLNVFVFTGYDTLAARYVRHPLPYAQTAIAAATSIPVSNSVGLALLSGSAIRYRFYAPWGVPPLKIAQIIAFCNLSFWLGLFSVGGLLFLLLPIKIPPSLHLPVDSTQPIGAIFLSVIVAYLLWNVFSPKSLSLGKTTIPHLPIPLCIGQIAVSSLDWTLAAAVLYALLPTPAAVPYTVPYTAYFGIYLLAQFAGVVSNVPGGLGVFETVMLLLLRAMVPSSALFGALIAYRVVYYLLPLSLAVLLMAGYEIWSRPVD